MTALPGFADIREIEIEPTTGCTRRCWFCHPGVPPERRSRPVFLPLLDVEALAEELTRLRYAGRITLCGLGEPLMHPLICEMAQAIRAVPGAIVMLYTNGDLVTDSLASGLAPFVDEVVFSDYDGSPETARRLGAAFGDRLRRELHVGRPVASYHSRAGNIRPALAEWVDRPRRLRCHWFRHKLFRTADALWATCCNDMARLNTWPGGVADLLNNPQYRVVRGLLSEGRAGLLDPCCRCAPL